MEHGDIVLDENTEVRDEERIPIRSPLKVIKYRTIKKNSNFGWWSAIVLLEDHEKRQVCYYRWRKKNGEWKRNKKLPIHSRQEWVAIKSAVEDYLVEAD